MGLLLTCFVLSALTSSMSNTYGFDFLRSEHNSSSQLNPFPGLNPVASSITSIIDERVEEKPDLEKQFIILQFLQAHRGSGCLAAPVLKKAVGIDLDRTSNATVASLLQDNPKIRVEWVPDPENPALTTATYGYQAKYASVRDRTTLLAQINRMTSGIPMRDLMDSYATVEQDLQSLITSGDIIAVANTEDKDKILFPRGESYLVELDGHVNVASATSSSGVAEKNNPMPRPAFVSSAESLYVVHTDIDPRPQIRRGEAIQIGGQWFRVSSAVRDGSLSDQPTRAQAPLSVVSKQDLSQKNDADGYIRPFRAHHIPLDAALTPMAQGNLRKAVSARERLLKLLHGRSAAGQLLGSLAHSSNPTTLAQSLTTATNSNARKRPLSKMAAPSASSVSASVVPPVDQRAQRQQQQQLIAQVASDPALALYSHARRHGCSKDVRAMYLATQKDVPESDTELKALLVKHNLLQPCEPLRRPRLKVSGSVLDDKGKPKKRRYYEKKNQRWTNNHLEGTAIGAVLARAAERQKQGQNVGDGGM